LNEYLLIGPVFSLIFGLLIGSFINCLAWRLYKEETIFGRSYCPKCLKQILWHDNIPLLSFILLKGKCRSCSEKISWQYPLVELATGLLFYFSFSILRLREISKSVMEDVKIGNVEMLFSKPISYVFYRIWWQIGSGLYSFVVVTTLAVLALIFIIGLPHTMTIGIFIPILVL